jgi:glycosyltransferase involved in cell wall biosynthesis
MPCFNAEAHVAEAVASVLGQTHADIELIVVNDGSTDGTLRMLSSIRDSRIKVISQQNRGVSAARNRGLAEATGSLVAFLDSDDGWRPDCLEKLYRELSPEPDAVLAYCGWQNVGLPGGRGEPYIPEDYEAEGKLEHLLRCCPWPIHAALARREALEEAGGFDERRTQAEDYGLWLRVAAFRKIIRVPEVMAFYNFHAWGQASENRLEAARGQLQVQQEFLKENPAIVHQLGKNKVRQLTYGALLNKGFHCYWNSDLETAREIFRMVMLGGYGSLKEWQYMIFAFLPLKVHRRCIDFFGRCAGN